MRIAAFFLLAATTVAIAAEDQPTPPTPRQLTGEELRREVPGRTISGRHFNGMRFSEYHAPDGRVLGHNNHERVQQGCWRIIEDQVCYTYDKGAITGLFCWKFFRAQGGYTIYLEESGTVGTAKAEPGNPYGWDDGGKPWDCNLMSMR